MKRRSIEAVHLRSDFHASELPKNAQKPCWCRIGFFLLILLVLGIYGWKCIDLREKLASNRMSLFTPQSNLESSITTPTEGQGDDILVSRYADPVAFYEVYYNKEPDSINVFFKTREVPQKTIQILKSRLVECDLGNIIWSPIEVTDSANHKQQFILTLRCPLGISRYYVLDTNGSEATELEFTNVSEKTQFEVLAWLQDDQILIKQQDYPELESAKSTITYWLAPVLDLTQKRPIKLD